MELIAIAILIHALLTFWSRMTVVLDVKSKESDCDDCNGEGCWKCGGVKD